MLGWRITLKIKDLLSSEDVTPEQEALLGQEVAVRIENQHPFSPRVNKDLTDRFADVVNQEDFNDCMDYLYDAADEERVWIG
jgi:hypothetical protein